MRWKEINEAPLADFGVHGDTSQEGSFRADDLKAMQNPKWVKKVENFLSRVPQDINLYLVNHAPIGTHNRYRNVSDSASWSGIRSMHEIKQVLGKVPPNHEQSITVVLYENEGDERLPLTPWMVAHRMAHALLIPNRGEIGLATGDFQRAATNFISGAALRMKENQEVKDELEALGLPANNLSLRAQVGVVSRLCKFKSAEHGAIVRPGELIVELLTQYLVQGKISFKRPDIDPQAGRASLPAIGDDEAQLFHLANEWALASIFNHDGERFAERMLGSKRPREPRDHYVAYDTDGTGIASFGDESRIKDYEDRGLTVKLHKATPQLKTAYRKWEEKMQHYAAQFDKWREEGRFKDNSTINDKFDKYLNKAEETLNGDAHKILVRLIGKAVVL